MTTASRESSDALDVAIIGAGPAGLAAAIAAKRRGLVARVFEKGVLVNSLQHYPTHMVFFTTPELLEIGGLPFVTPYEKPTSSRGAAATTAPVRVTDTFSICSVHLGGTGHRPPGPALTAGSR